MPPVNIKCIITLAAASVKSALWYTPPQLVCHSCRLLGEAYRLSLHNARIGTSAIVSLAVNHSELGGRSYAPHQNHVEL
jgi:hypothetical protein